MKITESQRRNLIILRTWLNGSKHTDIAKALGLSTSRVPQIVHQLIRRLRAYVEYHGGDGSSELANKRYMTPQLHREYWLGILAQYEAKHGVCTLNETIPDTEAAPVGLRGEAKYELERQSHLRRMDWYRWRRKGESVIALAASAGITPATVNYGVRIVHRYVQRRIDQKFGRGAHIAPTVLEKIIHDILAHMEKEVKEAAPTRLALKKAIHG